MGKQITSARMYGLSALLVMLLTTMGWSADKWYAGPNGGFWTTNANWTPAGKPLPGDAVHIVYDGNGDFQVRFNDAGSYSPEGRSLNELVIDSTTGITFLHPDSGFFVPYRMAASLEYVGYNAQGTYSQSAGENYAGTLLVAYNAGSRGIYNLSGGELSASNELISDGFNALGFVVQTGGSNQVSGLFLGSSYSSSNGTYRLGNGSLQTDKTVVGDTGTGFFTQSGGTHNTNLLTISAASTSHGTYQLQDGTLTAGRVELNGIFQQSGGVLKVTGDEAIGLQANGIFTQSGGVHTVGGWLFLPQTSSNSLGTFDLQAGWLTAHAIRNNGSFRSTGTLSVQTDFINTGSADIGGVQNWSPGSFLIQMDGSLTLRSNAGTPAIDSAAAEARLTLNVGAKVVVGSDQDLQELNVFYTIDGNQSFDLNTPASPGVFNAIRVYAADLTAAKANLWSAIKNANVPGSLTPTDGIYDSGLPAHTNSGIGLARIKDLHGDPHIEIHLARIGDLNLDNQVTISDFIDLASNFNSTGPNITWQEGDLNYDGSVTISDFIDLAANFNSTYAGEYALLADFATRVGVDPSVIGSSVPEPATLFAFSCAALSCCRRRRLPLVFLSARASQ